MPKKPQNKKKIAPKELSLEAYRDKDNVRRIADAMAALKKEMGAKAKTIKIMHVCGTHENSINRFGIRELLPKGVEVIPGPGCPVCVTPASDIDMARRLAVENKVILATFGDMVKVPTPKGSLSDARGSGADVRIVYSPSDAVKLAADNPGKKVVFFAIGFETTACTTAALVQEGEEAKRMGEAGLPENLSLLVSHRLIPSALEALIKGGEVDINGLLMPGHVTAVAGLRDYEIFPKKYKMPTASAGFEPVDILLGIYMILDQIRKGKPECANAYKRAVKTDGNPKAIKAMADSFDIVNARWRGIGELPNTGYALKDKYASLDAQKLYNIQPDKNIADVSPGCSCHLIMVGKISPPKCPLFGKKCTPESPYGPCMVSMEGTCRIWYKYRRV